MVSVTIKVPYINPNDLKYFDVSLIDFKLKNISIVFLYVSRIKHFSIVFLYFVFLVFLYVSRIKHFTF